MTASTSPVLERAERFLASGNWPQAEAVLRGAVEQHPADEKITLAWCNLLLTYGDVREGRNVLKNLEAAGGGHPLVPFCLALGYQSDGDFAAARGILEKLRATHPHWTQATHLLVRMLSLEDKHTEAAAIVEPLLPAGDPLVVCGFGLIAPRVGRTEEAIERLRAVCQDADVSAGIRMEAGLLLGRILDTEGRFEEALQAAERAHALRPSHYDPVATEGDIEGRIRSTSAAHIQNHFCAVGDTARPIFILGMPRSGTSLTEAILGEHSQIGPLGECRIIERFVPLNLADGPLVTKTSAQVLTVYRQLDGEHRRVTDKQLGNFLHLDAIAALLPDAHVIWCRRDVRDVAISCFFQQFQTGAPWAGNIEHILHYEQLYSRLMQHWEQVLQLPLLQLEYESLVEDPRGQVSRMLNFLGLAWEEQCLKFDTASRTTLTASSQQVRKKVYRSSVGRWQHYAQLFTEAEN